MTNVREYGHQVSGKWQVRRRTQYFYKSDSDTNYFNANLWRLVTQVSVFDAKENTNDGDDAEIAKTTYTFDNYAALGGMQDYFNSSSAPGHDNSFGTGQTVRGNITGLTDWVDLAVPTTIIRLAKFDVFGNLVKAQVTCCNERSWTFADSNWYAHPTQITNGNPTGVHLRTTVAYDFNTSLVNQQTDPNNLVTSYEYDAARRLDKTTFPTGATSEMTYNDGALTMSSDLKYVESGVNRTVTGSAVYDGWGRVTQRVGTNSIQVNTAYDRMGRIESRTNPFPQGGGTLNQTTFEYDPLSRLKEATLPDLNTVSNTFFGTSVTPKDQVGREVKREFDGLGRLVKVTEPDSTGALTQVTTYSYDLLDRLVEIDQGGQKRKYKYDALGRLLFERIPERDAMINDGTGTMWSIKYKYTDFHAVSIKTEARSSNPSDPQIVETHNRYDSLNRLVETWYTGEGGNESGTFRPALPSSVAVTPNVVYTYDTNTTGSTTKGLLLGIDVGTFYQEDYSYDSFNRVSSKQVTIDSNAYTTGYEYNTASQITKITYPSGRQVAYGHDSKGRVNSIGSHVTSISYNNEGLLSALTLGNGVSESFSYNSRLQLTNQTATKSGNTMLDLTYNYQAAAGDHGTGTGAGNSGQLISITDTSTVNGELRNEKYKYDHMRRLVSREGWGGGQRKMEYDRWGNRTRVWNSVNGGQEIQTVTLQQSAGAPTNRITSVTNTSGNLSQMLTYQYDGAGNVTNDGQASYKYDGANRLAIMSEGSPQQASYSYDSENRRVKKVHQSNTTYYIWEGSQVIAEYGSALDEGGGDVRYLLSDRLSTRTVLDSNGAVKGTQDHLVYGEESASAGEAEKHRFTSYERDTESGLDYAVNRHYASDTGRFRQVDPVAGNPFNPQRLNRYSYVGSDPVNRTDPSGRDWFDEWMDASNPSQFFSGHEFTEWITDQENRAFFGYRYYDLPGNFNPLAQEEERHLSIITTGIDPEFCRNFAAQVPSYDSLGVGTNTEAALEFLDRNFHFLAPAVYASWTATQQAVFLNTIAALSAAGVNLSNARFGGFYPSANRTYGINLLGLTESDLGDLESFGDGFRSPSDIRRGSIEATPIRQGGNLVGFAFDIDLYNPNSIALPLHGFEVLGNEITGGITNPISAAFALQSRGVFSGIDPVCIE